MTIAMERPTRGTGPDVPAPTRDLEQGLANIREHGFTIVPDVLTGDTLERTREALYREIAWDQKSRRHVPHPFDAQKSPNVRVWNLISKDPLFAFGPDHTAGAPHSLRDVEWVVIQQAVDVAQGNVALAAARLGISRATLYRRLAGQKLRRE